MVFGLKLSLPKKTSTEPAEPPVAEATAASKAPAGGALTVNEFVSRTKKSREKGLAPTKPELVAYARYLGMDPITDGDLLWIAEEALSPPLPAEWTEHHDSADRVFYYNAQTQGSCWVHPLEQLHRDAYTTIANFRSGTLSKEEQKATLERERQRCERLEREVHAELQSWTEHVDDEGQKFYYSRERQCSVWTDPRPSRCHCLYLQMKALKALSKHYGQTCGEGQEVASPIKTHYDFGDATGPVRPFDTAGPLGRKHSPLTVAIGVRTEGAADEAGGKGDRRRRKKRRGREGAEGELLAEGGLAEEGSFGEAQSPLNRRNVIATVEEVRAALGVSASAPGGALGLGRLQTPPGDGLSTVGRTKVRAGIRLEPIKGG